METRRRIVNLICVAALAFVAILAFAPLRVIPTSLILRDLYYTRPQGDVPPLLYWLLSYPESGADEVQQLIHHVTGTSTATNYGTIIFDTNNNLIENSANNVPFHYERWLGPWKARPDLPHPQKVMLTKTHCDGVCFSCHPNTYTLSTEDNEHFFQHCGKGVQVIDRKFKFTRYYPYHGRGSMILVRNPFDVLIRRFRHYRAKKADADWASAHPDNAAGFMAWCDGDDFDPELITAESRIFEPELFQTAITVPCRAEIYRYVKFYDNALTMSQTKIVYRKGGPHMTFYYENFVNSKVRTTQSLLDFLKFNDKPESILFEFEGIQDDFMSWYTEEQRRSVATYIKQISSLTFWNNIKGYVQQYL